MKNSAFFLIAAGIVAYYFFTNSNSASSSQPNLVNCQFPDGTVQQIPVGNQCPYDASHGGQSTMCYPQSFVGPLPQDGSYCGQ